MYLYKKIVSYLDSFLIPVRIDKISLMRGQKESLIYLKRSAAIKNKRRFKSISSVISNYMSTVSNKMDKHFEEKLLWQVADYSSSFMTVLFLVEHEKQLLDAFEDLSDLVAISKHSCSYRELGILCDYKRRSLLLRRLGSFDLVKISSRFDAVAVLEMFLNHADWLKLRSVLSKEVFLKIASCDGAKVTLSYFLNDEIRFKLIKRVGFDLLIYICMRRGAKNILAFYLDDDKWSKLAKRLGEDGLRFVSKFEGAKHILEILENNDNWFKLEERLLREGILRMISNNFTRSFFMMILDDNKWFKLLERLGADVLFKASNFVNVKHVFDMILDDNKWFKLLDRLGFDVLFKASNFSHVKYVFDMILDNDIWDKLLDRISKESVYKILTYDNAKMSLELILKDDLWEDLLSKIDKSLINRILSFKGGGHILNIVLDKLQWCKISSRMYSNCAWNSLLALEDVGSILPYVLDDIRWCKLRNRLGEALFIQCIVQGGYSKTFNFILDDASWRNFVFEFSKSQISHLILSRVDVDNLKYFFSNKDFLKGCLTNQQLQYCLFMSNKHFILFTHSLFKEMNLVYGFSVSETLILLKCSHRHLYTVLDLVRNNSTLIFEIFNSLGVFGEPRIMIPLSFKKVDSTNKLIYRLAIVFLSDLHQYCLSAPLTSFDFVTLSHMLNSKDTQLSKFSDLQRLVCITGDFSSSDRFEYWYRLDSLKWLGNDDIFQFLKLLSMEARKILIEKGSPVLYSFMSNYSFKENGYNLSNKDLFVLQNFSQKSKILSYLTALQQNNKEAPSKEDLLLSQNQANPVMGEACEVSSDLSLSHLDNQEVDFFSQFNFLSQDLFSGPGSFTSDFDLSIFSEDL